MFRKLFGRGGITIDLLLGEIRNGLYGRNLWGPIGQGSSFIKGDLRHTGKALEGISFSHQKSMLCGIADSSHNCGRGSKNQRTWTKHNQNGHRTDDFSGKQPGKSSGAQCNDNDPSCPSVCQANDFRLLCISRLHQADHSLDGAILTDFGRLHFKCPELINGTGRNLITNRFIDWEGFTGHNRLIDGGLAR